MSLKSMFTDAVSSATTGISGSTFSIESASVEPYEITPTNWYKSLPYGFAFYDITSTEAGSPKSTIYLPISPNNLSMNTNFATNIITTLYGIVEEHSEIRYYDITISGNTGYAPRFVAPFESGTRNEDAQSLGRAAFKTGGIDLGGFLPEVTNTINQALNIYQDISDTISGGPANPTGIAPDKTGYVAFHNLNRFFKKYKADTAQISASSQAVSSPLQFPKSQKVTRQLHPLQFLNYKDGLKYDCIPISFTMTRSADNPLLYNYTIRLKAFNERNVNEKNLAVDQRKAELGLDGLEGQTLFSKFTKVAGSASTAISALL